MSQDRPPIPRGLERDVLVEAGHRCAIPRCLQYPVQIHHIVNWEQCQRHEFENLIALCGVCHDRTRLGGRAGIDRQSLRRYKANLGIMNSRYNDQERRLLEAFAAQPNSVQVFGADAEFTFMYLLKDSLVRKTPGVHRNGTYYKSSFGGRDNENSYVLTEQGLEWINNWINGELA